jgi:hypothetical protein
MEQSTSWKVNSRSDFQEIPRTLQNTIIHYCVDKSPPLGPTNSQTNPSTALHPISLGLILILSAHQRPHLPSGLFLSGSSTKNSVFISYFSHAFFILWLTFLHHFKRFPFAARENSALPTDCPAFNFCRVPLLSGTTQIRFLNKSVFRYK